MRSVCSGSRRSSKVSDAVGRRGPRLTTPILSPPAGVCVPSAYSDSPGGEDRVRDLQAELLGTAEQEGLAAPQPSIASMRQRVDVPAASSRRPPLR